MVKLATKALKPDRALIDGDILVYRVGFASEDQDQWIVKARMAELISRITDTVECAKFEVILTSTDKSNFRFSLSSDYKANRKAAKPKHYEYCRELLRDEYGAITVDGEEADDAMGYMSDGDKTIICSIDKDLDQIPGWHYNFVKEIMYYIEPIEAARWFYQQVLIGDTSDNIKGCPKVGQVKANRILEGCQSEREMFVAVVDQYKRLAGPRWSDSLLLAGNLLWIRKRKGQSWELHPIGRVLKEHVETCLGSWESTTASSPSLSDS